METSGSSSGLGDRQRPGSMQSALLFAWIDSLSVPITTHSFCLGGRKSLTFRTITVVWWHPQGRKVGFSGCSCPRLSPLKTDNPRSSKSHGSRGHNRSGSLLHILASFLLSLLSKRMPSTPVFPEENGWTVLFHQVGTSSPICQTPEFPSLASCKSRPLLKRPVPSGNRGHTQKARQSHAHCHSPNQEVYSGFPSFPAPWECWW